MLLDKNYRPDIAYAVHNCVRFTHYPKASHGYSVKLITRYLKGTKDKGLIILINKNLQVECHVDADFYEWWNAEHEQYLTCVKSYTGYFILFMNFPLLRTSKLQNQIYLSTMEAEYVTLFTAMHEIIGVCELLKKVYSIVFKSSEVHTEYCTIPKTFGTVPQ